MYIYLYTNKLNQHKYVGQTNDLQKRFNGHKSDSYNKNSHSYNYPLHNAIRKYGIENFDYSILEEVETREQANERERFWIKELKSHVSEGGYNITWGGDGNDRDPLTWEELLEKGKLFTAQEIEDIQQRLIRGEIYNDIIDFYAPRLTRTFLSNLNQGVNFKNPKLIYPLKTDFSYETGKLTEEQVTEIKKEIKAGVLYKDICKKYGIASQGFISMVNSGKYYFDPNETYPLKLKGCKDTSWVNDCIYDVIFSDLSLVEIAKKYNKSEATLKKLSRGLTHKQDDLIYPLRTHIVLNREIYNKRHV